MYSICMFNLTRKWQDVFQWSHLLPSTFKSFSCSTYLLSLLNFILFNECCTSFSFYFIRLHYICRLAIHLSFFISCLFTILPVPKINGLFAFVKLSSKCSLYIFQYKTFVNVYFLIFNHSLWLAILLNYVLQRTEMFNFSEIQLINLFFIVCAIKVLFKKDTLKEVYLKICFCLFIFIFWFNLGVCYLLRVKFHSFTK